MGNFSIYSRKRLEIYLDHLNPLKDHEYGMYCEASDDLNMVNEAMKTFRKQWGDDGYMVVFGNTKYYTVGFDALSAVKNVYAGRCIKNPGFWDSIKEKIKKWVGKLKRR